MFKRLLVPLDGSELAERALPMALELLSGGEGEIILLRVPVLVPMSRARYSGALSWWYPDQAEQRARQQAKEYLAGVCEHVARPGVVLRPEVEEGDAASCIVDLAQARDVDAIVMTTHGYSGLTHWFMGSVTDKVVRAAHRPVLIVRDARPVRRILVTVDGSARSELALPPAISVAQRLDADVTCLHVIEPLLIFDMRFLRSDYTAAEVLDVTLEAAEEDAQRYVASLAERFGASGVQFKPVVRDGPVADTILSYAAEQETDLVVMATHGRTGLSRWVYGSVAQKVLRRICCALLLVPIPDEQLRSTLERERSMAKPASEKEPNQPRG